MTDKTELLKPTIEELEERAGTGDCDYAVLEAAAEWVVELKGKIAMSSTATGMMMVHGEIDRLSGVIYRIADDVAWYIQCREFEGYLYDMNFIDFISPDALAEISASTGSAMGVMKKAIAPKGM
ncbi:hypothetical protein SYK_07190 [Pseudodesulfovibrio nedwellii]|uniref:Uncharacterized protein n=1 Tax=Pseudodesulfovibrio nedwellii TaxID=2973072 RepID=A0ABN6S092_9BACT|nr:hypothetical protein [Pseudodesulfovibrio nedwellii]BDQ36359.1 hypothetical protein SYK_07190 [Pseudodesulfovibrio nedwellii]